MLYSIWLTISNQCLVTFAALKTSPLPGAKIAKRLTISLHFLESGLLLWHLEFCLFVLYEPIVRFRVLIIFDVLSRDLSFVIDFYFCVLALIEVAHASGSKRCSQGSLRCWTGNFGLCLTFLGWFEDSSRLFQILSIPKVGNNLVQSLRACRIEEVRELYRFVLVHHRCFTLVHTNLFQVIVQGVLRWNWFPLTIFIVLFC